jgi:bifunctional aspartokinase / homoserine dehydrogenase 1
MDMQPSNSANSSLRIMKFGGTSVGDGPRIRKVVEIIRDAARESELVVVVSAMSGVTNRLIEAAKQSEAGNRSAVEAIFEELRDRHHAVVSTLIRSIPMWGRINRELRQIFEEGERLCQGTIFLRELTARAHDSIASLGERLSARIVAAAIAESGTKSEAVDATELVVTDSCHGSADPLADLTRQRCESRLRPLLQQGIVPVVTGFIGATTEGRLTTLGRGGSDYSATILGAALHADEVIIWTDVDGLMTADPRLVPGAATITEISYREAAEFAHFGAKVLHPKTLRAVTQYGIPLWIRNTFFPERPGTRVTPDGPPAGAGVKGLTAMNDVALITVGGPGLVGVPDVLGRTFATTQSARANVLLLSQSSSQNDICLVVPSSAAERTVEALRTEFARDLVQEKSEHIGLDKTAAIVTVVGKDMRGSEIAGRVLTTLSRENVGLIATAQGSSDCNISFLVKQQDVQTALHAMHQEFELGALGSRPLPVRSVGVARAKWYYESSQQTASAD